MDDAIAVPEVLAQPVLAGAARPRVYVVAGMHRAGTSVVARALQALGIALGDRLMSADVRMNARGFFEDVDVVAIDDALLADENADWKSVALLEDVDWCNPGRAPLRDRAEALLRARIARTGEFGFKDPRVPRLLPFWQGVIRDIDAIDAYVVALRHPLSVIESLTTRDHLDVRRSGWLWLTHVLSSLQYTSGRRRVIVDYDRLLAEPERELARMADRLGRGAPSDQAVEAYVSGFLSHELRHARHDPADVPAAAIPPLAIDAYALAQRLAQDELDADATAVQSQIEDLFDELCRFSPLLAYAGSAERGADEVPRLAGELEWARKSLDRSTEYVESLKGALAQSKSLNESKDAELAKSTAYSNDLCATLERKERELREAHNKLARLGKTVLGRMALREAEKRR